MKTVHKLLAMLLTIMLLASSLVSCDLIGGLIGGTENPPEPEAKPSHTHFYVNGKCECGKIQPGYEFPHEHRFILGKCECGEIDPSYTFPHEHAFVDGKCECGEFDPSYTLPHEHTFIDGKCECGEIDPNYTYPHSCESLCPECGLCLDAECGESVCYEKCSGHDENADRYDFFPTISETMPQVHINTADGSNSWATRYNRNDKLSGNIEYVNATVSITECENEYELTDLEAQVKVRGNYTLDYEKKPIRIKFSSKQSVLGLHDGEKYKNWVLLADWKDLSMMNNTVAFYLGNMILGSDGYYCTDFRNVEVYLNGEYWGVYLLVEQQEAKDGRGGVSEVEDNYTGNDIGYFFEYDGYYADEKNIPDGDPTFTMNHQGLPASSNGYTVKSDIYADSQLNFLQSYMNNVMYIAYQATKGNFYKMDANYRVVSAGQEASAKEIIGSVIDLQSLVDTYILNEIAKDFDVDWSSFYLSLDMTADGNKKVTFEAPWDFDSSFGLVSRDNCATTTGLYAATDANPWFQLVAGQDWFWEMVYEKWAEMKEFGVFDGALELIRQEKEAYKNYYIKNYERWSSRVLYGNDECVPQINNLRNIYTAQGLAADYLSSWLTARIAWLDSQWSKVETPSKDIPESANPYRYEAEDAELIGFVSDAIRYNRDFASGNAYVGRVDNGNSIRFTVTADESGEAYLFLGVSKRIENRIISEMFSITVNGNRVSAFPSVLPAISDGEDDWHVFVSIRFADIKLNKGENTIVISVITNDGANFDYIEIYSEKELK